MTMRFEKWTITPEVAGKLLASQVDNRVIRGTRVAYYADQLKAKRWIASHQAIGVLVDGRIFEGQHRCVAIQTTGISAEMWVALDCPFECWNVTDRGLGRTVSDILMLPAKLYVRPAAFITARLHTRPSTALRSVDPQDVRPVLEVIRGGLDAMYSRSKRVVIHDYAAIRAAAAIRYLEADGPRVEDYILDQWEAFAKNDGPRQSEAIAALIRRCSSGFTQVGFARENAIFATAWTVFNYERSTQKKLSVKVPQNTVDEALKTYRTISKRVIIAVPQLRKTLPLAAD